MDAQTTWHVWRRILREPRLQEAMEQEDWSRRARAEFGLTETEARIADEYAKQLDRARWFIINYRFRLGNSLLNALETGAPLTLRALLAKKVDLKALAQTFLDEQGWRDYGPFVYTYCADVLTFLTTREVSEKPEGLRDLIGLEKTVLDLLRALASNESKTPAANQELRPSPYARLYKSAHRLSLWLRDKSMLGRTDIAPGEEWFVAYLPAPESGHRFASIPARAAALYHAIGTGCDRRQLRERLRMQGSLDETPEDPALLELLAKCRALEVAV